MKKIILLTSVILLLIFFFGFEHYSCKENSEVKREIKSQLDISPNENQVDYSPEDGSIVSVNPPPFTWLPVRKNIVYPYDYVQYSGSEFRDKVWTPLKNFYTYTIQLSQDKDFRTGVISRKGIDISTFSLDKSLEPGEWYWRYGVENGSTIFSKSRRFIVPSEARHYPFPNIKEVVNSIPGSHPRLFILNDEIDAYRNRSLYGDLKETVSEIRHDIEKHIGEELIKEPPFTKGIGPEFGEYSWRNIFNVTLDLCNKTEAFGLIYLLTADKKFGEEAKRRVLHISRWDPEGGTSDRANDEPAMLVLAQGSRAYDWTYDLYTPEEREIVNRSMIRRAEQFYQRLKYREDREYHVYNRGSHEERICGFLGEAAICFMDECDEAEEWLKYVLTIHWNLYPAWAKEDGGWHQGPSYWTFYHWRVLHFITALKKATNIDLTQKEFFQNTPYYILYTNPPYAKLSPFGDGEHKPPPRDRAEMMYNYSTLLNDSYLRWYADFMGIGHEKRLLGILLKNDEFEGKPPTDLPQSRYFPGVGLVSLHTDFGNADEDIHFLFHSDPFGGVSHGHPDQNAFTIEAFGEALAIASGYYPWYGSDHHLKWQRQTKSSNSITIDGGKGQQGIAAAKGSITTFENKDKYDYIVGDATQAYMGLLNKFYRHIIHIRPGVFVMYDNLEAPGPVTFEWLLHALSEMKINESDKSLLISEGNSRLKISFLQSEKLNFEQYTGFPVPPEIPGDDTDVSLPQHSPQTRDQWHLTASTVSKSDKAKFITVIVPFKKGMEPDMSIENYIEEEDKISMELKFNGKRYQINLLPNVSVMEIVSE
jgi:hypothetical protein